ncbi:MAG: hypothetical protein K0R54_1863 [Clostridiaceae bacterium]|jgi:hypothetical protein|nr:hypothetical protein [Clostridiaceae bacterium]
MDTYIKGFLVDSEAYSNEIMIGFYSENDKGTQGEFAIRWNPFPRLEVYYDGWSTLAEMPELIELLAKIDKTKEVLTINKMVEMLLSIGFKDLTKRIKYE